MNEVLGLGLRICATFRPKRMVKILDLMVRDTAIEHRMFWVMLLASLYLILERKRPLILFLFVLFNVRAQVRVRFFSAS